MDSEQSQAGPQPLAEEPAGQERTTEQVRAEIEQTRAELGDTVAALAEKTDVKAQAKKAASNAKDSVNATVTDLKHAAAGKKDEYVSSAQAATPDSASEAGRRGIMLLRANPILSTSLAALAIGWLLGRRSAR